MSLRTVEVENEAIATELGLEIELVEAVPELHRSH